MVCVMQIFLMFCVAYRVLTVEFEPWLIKPSSRISMDRSSRGDQADALCRHQKYNSRRLGVGWGGKGMTNFICKEMLHEN